MRAGRWERGLLVMALVVSGCVRMALAEDTQKKPAAAQWKDVSHEMYLAQLQNFHGLLSACHSNPKACDAKAVGDDVRVAAGAGQPEFTMRWEWLRDTLSAAQKAKGAEREKLFREASDRLNEETAEAGGAGPATPDVNSAAAKTQAILAASDFRHVAQTSWLQEKIVQMQFFLSSLFSRFEDALPSSSWIGEAVQWGILAAAAIAVGLWAWRTTRQQRVAIAGVSGAAPLWHAESERWADRAAAEAERGDWREAVHCLYWAAIVMLEGQKMWRANRTRTPREYVRLLEPGSARAGLLGALTGVFERIWYGLRAAERADYERARGLLEQLRAG